MNLLNNNTIYDKIFIKLLKLIVELLVYKLKIEKTLCVRGKRVRNQGSIFGVQIIR